MKKLVAIVVVIIAGSLTNTDIVFSQSFERYVRSFKKIQSNAPISFGKLMQIDNPMTRQEAIKFVYYGDSSKLICVSEQYNQMTEKFEGISKYLNLPSKNMLLAMKEYSIIANSEYDCNDPKKQSISYLKLTIVNKQFVRMDSLIVYREKYDNPEIVGLINPKNGNVFLIGYLKTKVVNPSDSKQVVYAMLLGIDKATFKLRILKEASGLKGGFENPPKILTNLGWDKLF